VIGLESKANEMTEKTAHLNRTQAKFDQTHWSLILPAVNQQAPGAQEALEQLCTIYWPPLYAFLRQQGRSPEDAQDLTQGFFLHLLSRDRLGNVHPAKGKFRTFLLRCLTHYLINEYDKAHAQKRDGGRAPVPINTSEAETHYHPEPSDPDDPAKVFERHWASTLLAQVLQQLKQLSVQGGHASLFEVLLPFLTDEAERGDYAVAAAKLNLNEGAVRTAASRLRKNYRELLRAEVARTVSSPAEVDDEIRHLFSLFRRN